jgi:hypothetical protein
VCVFQTQRQIHIDAIERSRLRKKELKKLQKFGEFRLCIQTNGEFD